MLQSGDDAERSIQNYSTNETYIGTEKVLTSGWDFVFVFASCARMIQTVHAFRKVGPVHVPWYRLWSVSDFPAAKSPVALHLDTTLISPQNVFKIASIKFALAHSCCFCLLTLRTSWQYPLPAYREMSIQEISCSEEQCKDLSYSHVTVTAGGVDAQLFRRRYASVAQIRP